MSDVIDLFQKSHFMVGLGLGAIALVVGWAAYFTFGRRRRPVAIGGVLIATATAGTLYLVGEELGSLVPALALIYLGVRIGRFIDGRAWLTPLATVPGAAWLAFSTPVGGPAWVPILIAVLIPVGGYLTTDFETRHADLGLGLIFFSMATLGVFAAVPDTEQALSLMAVAVLMTFLGWPKVAGSLGPGGAYLAVAILLWVTSVGGVGRPSSIVASVACLGLLLMEPIVVAIRPKAARFTSWPSRTWRGAVLASLPQLVVVFVCSRIAARFTDVPPALVVVALIYALVIAIGVGLADASGIRPRESI